MSLASILTTNEPDIQPIRVPIDLANLTDYLNKKLPNFTLPIRKSGQFGLGQSNPTYYLQDDSGREYVVRCKPKGQLAHGAHQIDREFWIQSVVGKRGVPVPEMYAYCKDTSVIGVEFYCMKYLKGHVYGHMGLKGVDKHVQHECWKVAAHVMAQLHQLDPVELKLEKYGKLAGYYPRSIANWKRLSHQQAKVVNVDSGRHTGELAMLDEQISWFKRWLPKDETSICHFDFAFHNLMFSMPGEEPVKMVAVLDWELSTIGHPLADLGYFVQLLETPWPEGWKNVPKEEAGGIPSVDQVLEWYASARGWPLERVTERFGYHIVWSAFRSTVINQGIASRFNNKTAANALAYQFLLAVPGRNRETIRKMLALEEEWTKKGYTPTDASEQPFGGQVWKRCEEEEKAGASTVVQNGEHILKPKL